MLMGKCTSLFRVRLKMVLNIHFKLGWIWCVLFFPLLDSYTSDKGMGNGTTKMSVQIKTTVHCCYFMLFTCFVFFLSFTDLLLIIWLLCWPLNFGKHIQFVNSNRTVALQIRWIFRILVTCVGGHSTRHFHDNLHCASI